MERAVALVGLVLIVVAALVMGLVSISLMPGSAVPAYDPHGGSGTSQVWWQWHPGPPWPPSPRPVQQTVRVATTEFAFDPAVVPVPGGVPINLEVVNNGLLTHILSIPVLGTRVVVRPGESRIVRVGYADPGIYEFFCEIPAHRDAGMMGRLIVGPGVVARDSR